MPPPPPFPPFPLPPPFSPVAGRVTGRPRLVPPLPPPSPLSPVMEYVGASDPKPHVGTSNRKRVGASD